MHRLTNQKGIELIKNFEGFSSVPYICSGGVYTIGYGHKLLPSDKYNNITKDKADEILLKDLLRTERAVLKYITTELTDNQFAALVSFTFNLGPAALQRSVLRQKVNYELYHEASKEFLKWTYAGGKKITGLLHRRRIESQLFLE